MNHAVQYGFTNVLFKNTHQCHEDKFEARQRFPGDDLRAKVPFGRFLRGKWLESNAVLV